MSLDASKYVLIDACLDFSVRFGLGRRVEPFIHPSTGKMTLSAALDAVLASFARSWLPDGYSQIFRSYVFGPSGFRTMAPLRYAAKFDPFLSLDCARVEGVGAQSNFAIWQPCLTYLYICFTAVHPAAIQGKEGIKFCHLATPFLTL